MAIEKRLLHTIAASQVPVTAADLAKETATDELLISESIEAGCGSIADANAF
jgi:hypothetical protein